MVMLEMGDCVFGTRDAILVETVPPPGATEIGTPRAVELALPRLRRD